MQAASAGVKSDTRMAGAPVVAVAASTAAHVLSDEADEAIQKWRASRAGQLALRLYSKERPGHTTFRYADDACRRATPELSDHVRPRARAAADAPPSLVAGSRKVSLSPANRCGGRTASSFASRSGAACRSRAGCLPSSRYG